MPVKMKPTSVIKTQLGIEPNGRVQKYFTKRCADLMDAYIPMDVGNLRLIKEISSDTITYESPYARYQYYGMREDGTHQVHNYTTPGTGPYWDKRMWSANKEDIIQEVQNYMNRGGR